MKIVISAHACKRCLERGISPEQLLATLRKGRVRKNSGKALICARKRIRVVVSPEGVVVTAFRVRKLRPKHHMKRRRQLFRRYLRERKHEQLMY